MSGLAVRPLVTWGERLRGLLGTGPHTGAVILSPCRSVHTVGMRYPLDVAFVSREGRVLKVVRGMPPGRLASCRGARHVVERPAREGAWLAPGERVGLTLRVMDEGSVTHGGQGGDHGA